MSIRFHALMGGIMAALLVFDIGASRHVGLVGILPVLAKSLFMPAVLFVSAWHCRREKFERLENVCSLAAWVFLVSPLLSVLVHICGRSSAPLMDGALMSLDHRMGLDVPAIVRAIRSIPLLDTALSTVYDLFKLPVALAILVPAAMGKAERSRRYVVACTLASILCSAVSWVLPAIGPWTGHGFAPIASQQITERAIQVLRGAGPATLWTDSIISFPSFHVVLAILSAIALWHIRPLRWINGLFALGVCLSTMTTGWHYAADVLGGIAVAVIAQACAVTMLRIPLWSTLTEAFRPWAQEEESLAGR